MFHIFPRPLAIALSVAVILIAGGCASEYRHQSEPPEYIQSVRASNQRDYATSLKILLSLAEQGYLRAQLEAGSQYRDGLGTPQNDEKAVYWYRKAAEQGYPAAQFELGQMYSKGLGVPYDTAAANSWNRKAAAKGYGKAELRIRAVESTDRNELQELFMSAAKYGDVDGALQILDRRDIALDVDAWDIEGKSLLEKAASRGNIQFALALIARGANVNSSRSGWTPLHEAVRVGDLKMVQALIAHGSDLNANAMESPSPASPPGAGTPLHVAFRLHLRKYPNPATRPPSAIAHYLIASGSNIYQKDQYGYAAGESDKSDAVQAAQYKAAVAKSEAEAKERVRRQNEAAVQEEAVRRANTPVDEPCGWTCLNARAFEQKQWEMAGGYRRKTPDQQRQFDKDYKSACKTRNWAHPSVCD